MTALASLALVALAGVTSSAGSCVAPRFIAVAALCAGRRPLSGALRAASFTGGLCTVYALAGAGGGAAAMLLRSATFSRTAYLLMALVFGCAGLYTLAAPGRTCSRVQPLRAGFGGAFFLGAGSALIVSPCCAPLLLGAASYGAASGGAAMAALLCAVFAAGHAVPLFAAPWAGRILRLGERFALHNAASTLSGAVMLALAGYYGAIA